MKFFLIFSLVLGAAAGPVAAVESAVFESFQAQNCWLQPASAKVDALVFDRLKKLGIQPANPCSDAVFLRRVYLDVIGTLPTADEAKQFLDDRNPNKRSALIDQLLNRKEYAEYYGMKWCDLLRVKAEFPVNLWPNAAQAYDRWIRTSLRQNMPYSQFARELLLANGSNFRTPAVNFYRSAGGKDAKAITRAVAQTFMGERADKWPRAKWFGMVPFFSQIGFKATGEWKEEIVYFTGIDENRDVKGKPMLPDGTEVTIPPGQDPREIFTDWLINSKKSPFAQNAVNRIWFWLMGRGIIHEPDDARPDNPPSNPELLNFLAQELIAANYDMKHIYRVILNSKTYQLSSIPANKKPEAEANFACYNLRRMDAEVLIDALNQITGSTEEYSSMIPEPFTWVPEEKRSISLPDGSITSSFLELFGRPPRDTGLLSERANKPTSAQRLHLLNSSHVQSKITKSDKLRPLYTANNWMDSIVPIYLTVISRYPTDQEVKAVKDYGATSEAKGAQALYDLTWSLLNSTEFLYRH